MAAQSIVRIHRGESPRCLAIALARLLCREKVGYSQNLGLACQARWLQPVGQLRAKFRNLGVIATVLAAKVKVSNKDPRGHGIEQLPEKKTPVGEARGAI